MCAFSSSDEMNAARSLGLPPRPTKFGCEPCRACNCGAHADMDGVGIFEMRGSPGFKARILVSGLATGALTHVSRMLLLYRHDSQETA